jgi:hypothetical protein
MLAPARHHDLNTAPYNIHLKIILTPLGQSLITIKAKVKKRLINSDGAGLELRWE